MILCFITRKLERGCKPGRGAAGVKHEVAILRCAGWRRERHAERARQRRARRIDVDECDLGARRLRAQERNQRADNAGADHRDAIGRDRVRRPTPR